MSIFVVLSVVHVGIEIMYYFQEYPTRVNLRGRIYESRLILPSHWDGIFGLERQWKLLSTWLPRIKFEYKQLSNVFAF